MKGIKEQAFWGIVWRGGYQAFHQIASLIVKLLLVRLLLPADFGLLAMAMIVLTSLDIINRFAGGEPFIRDNTSDQLAARNTLFYMNSIFIAGTALVGFASAPYVAQFFSVKIPDQHSLTTLVWVIRVFSLRLFLSIFAAVPIAILTKDLRFREMYIANIAGTCTYAITAPILAFHGFGVWAIVLAHILEQIVITICFLYYAPFFPALILDRSIARKYIRYNFNIFASSIIMVIITNGDDTIIGRLMGPSILGFYNIGQQFSMLATLIISTNINAIIFPVLSKVQDDRETFSRVVFKTFRVVSVAAIPCIGGSVILAKEIVLCFFQETWLPMVPVFYILSIATLLSTIISVADPVFYSLNKPYLIRNSQLIGLTFFFILIYPCAKVWGYLGVCWVMVTLPAVAMIYLVPKLTQMLDSLYGSAVRILSRTVICTLFMMAAVYLLKLVIPMNILGLLIAVTVGCVIYSIPMLFCDNDLMNDIRDALTIVKEKLDFTTA